MIESKIYMSHHFGFEEFVVVFIIRISLLCALFGYFEV